MNQTLDIVQAVISVLLIISILLQNRGTGLSETFGGGSSSASYQTKRGFDKFLLRASIILCVLFLGTAIYGMTQGA
jgi:protein translocase SecG subunit